MLTTTLNPLCIPSFMSMYQICSARPMPPVDGAVGGENIRKQAVLLSSMQAVQALPLRIGGIGTRPGAKYAVARIDYGRRRYDPLLSMLFGISSWLP